MLTGNSDAASCADRGLDPKSGPFSGGEILVHGNLVPLT